MVEVPVYQGVNKASAGYKLMAAMGWKEGEGLGANKQGIKEHVKVKKKADATGLGAAEAAARMRDWSLGMVHFESVLSNLKEVTSQHTGRSRGTDTSDSDASGGEAKKEAPNAPGSKSNSKKVQHKVVVTTVKTTITKKKVKFQEKEALPSKTSPSQNRVVSPQPSSSASDASTSSESASSSGSDSEPEQPKPQPKVATHIGRYARRASSKLVARYSATDLAAILGATPAGAIRAVVAASSSDSGAESGDEAEDDTAAPAAKAGRSVPLHQQYTRKAPASPQLEEPEPCSGGGAPEASTSGGPPPWWSKLFVRAGMMGNMRQDTAGPSGKKRIQVTGFREEDQEALYEQAQHGKAQNRQGLGRSDQLKVAGVRCASKSIKLDSDDEGGEPKEQEGAEDDQAGEGADEVVIVAAKRSSPEAKAKRKAGKGGEVEGGEGRAKKGKKRRDCGGGSLQAETTLEEPPAASAGKKRQRSNGTDEGEAEQDKSEPSGGAKAGRVKWCKVVRKVLRAQGGVMKVRKLQQAAIAAAGLAASVDVSAVVDALMAKLQRSAKFVVGAKHVELRAA